jgi:hypothetical protein
MATVTAVKNVIQYYLREYGRILIIHVLDVVTGRLNVEV